MFTVGVEDLRRGIEGGEIEPYFQPVVELRTGQLCGYELLARWNHPTAGLIGAEMFVHLAEESGLVGPLMGTVLRRAFEGGRRLAPHVRLSVNVSPFQLRDHTLVQQIQDLAERSGFDVSRLTVEITEGALVGNMDHARTVTEDLKALGVRVALDDFGTGYSSLRHLHGLPFDELKVDKSFVQTMLERRESRKIVAAVLGLGQSLGMTTVAEGVEHKEQAAMLVWMGCDLGQGWLYGEALPAEELERDAGRGARRRVAVSGHVLADMTQLTETLPHQRSAQLRAIYDGAPVGLCYLDRSLRYVSLNRKLAELNNKPIAAHLGRTVEEIRPRMFKVVEPYLRRALAGEAIIGLEIEALREDPSERGPTVVISYYPALDEAGDVVGVSVSVMDVTKRESAERALKESEDNYRYTMELSPQVPWMADPEGRIVDVNRRWESLTGQTRGESLGYGWSKAVHPDDYPQTARLWKAALTTGRPLDVEFRVGRGDGVWRWVRSRAAPRLDRDGKILRWYGTLEDNDERKQEQEELRRSRALLQAVFEAVPVGIVIAEAPGGRVVMGNPRAEQILRHPMLETDNFEAHENWIAFRADGHRLTWEENPLVRAMRRGEVTGPDEYLYQKGDGSIGWVSLTAAPIRSEDGEVTGGVVAIRDVDQERRRRSPDEVASVGSEGQGE